MKSHAPSGVQFTVRNVPAAVARALRAAAKRRRKSLNRVLVELLSRDGDNADGESCYHDLDWLAGTWEPDPAFDAAIAAQDQVDESLW